METTEATENALFREVTAAELDPTLQGYWKRTQETLQVSNFKYAVTLLQAILKEAPGFLEGRQSLRLAEDKLVGGPKKKRGLFGTSVGAGSASVSKKYLAQASKDGNAALQAIEEELEKEPFSTSFNEALHDVAAQLGMVETAAFALETIRKAFPEESALMHKLAEYYLTIQRPLDAAGVYESIVKANPGDIAAVKAAKDCTAKASMLSNRNESGELVLQKKDAAETLQLEQASRSALTKEQMEARRDELSAQYAADQQNLNVVRDLAGVYENLEDWQNAHVFYDWGYQISNNDVALKAKAAKMKDRAAAGQLEALQQAVAADPNNQEIAQQLEEYQKALSAEQVVERTARVEENPTDPALRFALGEALYHAGDYTEAIKHLQQATRNPHIRTKVLVLLGRTFDKKGMTDMAINRFKEANEELSGMDATKKEVLYELGVIYDKQGSKEDAIASFKQIYEVDYGYRDVAERVESAYS